MPNPILYEKNCTVCGEKYEAKHNKSKYCSLRCKNKHVRGNATNEPQAHGKVSLELGTQLFNQLNEIREEMAELVSRVDALEEKDHENGVSLSAPSKDVPVFVDTVYPTRLGNMNPAMAAALSAPKKREFTYREIAIFNSYEEAKKKGGYYDPEQGFVAFEDIPVPDGYEAFLLTKE